jgi:hypothetical protein
VNTTDIRLISSDPFLVFARPTRFALFSGCPDVCVCVCLSALFSAILHPISIKLGRPVGRCSVQFRFSGQPAAPPSGGEIDEKSAFFEFLRFDFLKI